LQDPRYEDNVASETSPYGKMSNIYIGIIKKDGKPVDPSFDNTIMLHGVAHGTVNWLVGGYKNHKCITGQQAKGMNEGYSDFAAIWPFFAKATLTEQTDFPVWCIR
jgi:hypothetical protein